MYQYLSYRTDKLFKTQTSEGLYNTDDLTVIKIPANMPNVSEWAGYEKVNGSIRFANAAYNYVEMRVTRDFVYLKCIPNYETTRLSKENVIHAENIDMQIPKKEHVPYGKSTITYNLSFTFVKYQFIAPFNGLAKQPAQPVLQITCQSLDIPEQPPKSVC